jgi:hypothetical protein
MGYKTDSTKENENWSPQRERERERERERVSGYYKANHAHAMING